MPLAGRIAIDATVKPSRVEGIIVHAATQSYAEQALALLLEEPEAPEMLRARYRRKKTKRPRHEQIQKTANHR
jgi:hypothetical protein